MGASRRRRRAWYQYKQAVEVQAFFQSDTQEVDWSLASLREALEEDEPRRPRIRVRMPRTRRQTSVTGDEEGISPPPLDNRPTIMQGIEEDDEPMLSPQESEEEDDGQPESSGLTHPHPPHESRRGNGTTTTTTAAGTFQRSLANMGPEELEAELLRLEAAATKARNIQRIIYLQAGNTGTEAQQLVEQDQLRTLPTYESRGGHKRGASREFDRNLKYLKPDTPNHFDGTDYTLLENFIMSSRLYFEAVGYDLKNPDQAKTCIATAATWLDGDAKWSYTRAQNNAAASVATWDAFVIFLRGTIKDPQTRIFEATRRVLHTKQDKGQAARQYLHQLEAAEAEVKAASLPEEEKEAYRFLQGLRGPLRSAIMAEPQEVRKNRDGVLTAAVRHEARLAAEENNKHKGKEREDRDRSGPKNSRQSTSSSRKFHTNRVRSGEQSGNTFQPRREIHEKVHQERSTKFEKKGPLKCYTCQGPHKQHECPQNTNKGSKK